MSTPLITRQQQQAVARLAQLSQVLKAINSDLTNGLPAVSAQPAKTLPNGQAIPARDALPAVSAADVATGYPESALAMVRQILAISQG